MEIDPEWMMVVITAIYCVSTIVLVLENRKSNNLLREEIREMHRPIVSVYFTVSGGLGVLRVKNTGDAIAERLTLKSDEALFEDDEYCVAREQSRRILSSEINIGPGEYFDLCLGLTNKLVEEKRPRVITISYSHGEKQYHAESKVVFSEYCWARLEPGEYDELKRCLKEIND